MKQHGSIGESYVDTRRGEHAILFFVICNMYIYYIYVQYCYNNICAVLEWKKVTVLETGAIGISQGPGSTKTYHLCYGDFDIYIFSIVFWQLQTLNEI